MIGAFTSRRIAAGLGVVGYGLRFGLRCVPFRNGGEPGMFVLNGIDAAAAGTFGQFLVGFVKIGIPADDAAPEILLAEVAHRPTDCDFGVDPNHHDKDAENTGIQSKGRTQFDGDHGVLLRSTEIIRVPRWSSSVGVRNGAKR